MFPSVYRPCLFSVYYSYADVLNNNKWKIMINAMENCRPLEVTLTGHFFHGMPYMKKNPKLKDL